MTPQTSQTVPEIPGSRIGQKQEEVGEKEEEEEDQELRIQKSGVRSQESGVADFGCISAIGLDCLRVRGEQLRDLFQ
jgi:hypothetical protein